MRADTALRSRWQAPGRALAAVCGTAALALPMAWAGDADEPAGVAADAKAASATVKHDAKVVATAVKEGAKEVGVAAKEAAHEVAGATKEAVHDVSATAKDAAVKTQAVAAKAQAAMKGDAVEKPKTPPTPAPAP